MTSVSEIAPDLYRLSTYVPEANLQFNQFLLCDEQPVLLHTGMRGLFPSVKEAVARLIDPTTLRWIAFSHFEADECGSLREWQTLAPEACALCSLVGKVVSVDDVVAARPAQALDDGELISTGKYRLRFLRTPHVPHCWDAGLFFEETQGTLLCSDLFHQNGDVEPITSSDVIGRARQTLLTMRTARLPPTCLTPDKPHRHWSAWRNSSPGRSRPCMVRPLPATVNKLSATSPLS